MTRSALNVGIWPIDLKSGLAAIGQLQRNEQFELMSSGSPKKDTRPIEIGRASDEGLGFPEKEELSLGRAARIAPWPAR